MNKYAKMLIVDDEPLVSNSLRALDEWEDMHVQVVGTALNGREALARIDEEPIDIVLTDIQMPDMDGLELLQEIYARNARIAVIIISGYEQFQYACTALKYKARGYILKPIDTDELFCIVKNILYEMRHTEQLSHLNAAGSVADRFRSDSTGNPAPGNSSTGPETYHEKLIRQAIDYLAKNLHKPVTLNEIASQFYLTPHYFGQIFKMVTGQTFTAYVTKLRMQKACELLKNPDIKHYEICQQIGYCDVKYFTKQFQRNFNLTPKEYKQLHYKS